MSEFTEDRILNGKIHILQPKNGYRVALDPIIFSSFINLKDNNNVLDIGCGVGTISLILKHKKPDINIIGVDIDEKMCCLCKENAKRNSLDIKVVHSAIEKMQKDVFLKDVIFDQVVTNPPFFDQKSSRLSEKKLLANFETTSLNEWIKFCLKKLKNGGIFSMIHLASRLNEVLYAINEKAGAIEVFPIHPKINSDANRIIVRCIKGSHSQMKIHHGLVVHNDDGKYTKNILKILNGNF